MEKAVKYFTPYQAERTLPLVRKIVEDILAEGKQLRAYIENADEQLSENDPEITSRMALIKSYLEELDEIGCFYKDWNFEYGLVDFPAVIEGREVLLCWKSDESNLLYYHGADEGFSGRKLIPSYLLSGSED